MMKVLLGLSQLVWLQGSLAQYTATYDPNNLPDTTEREQYGTNKCNATNSQDSLCQNAWINSAEDFCVWGPPEPNSLIGVIEQYAVAWCTKPGRGQRLIPEGTLKSVHFLQTPHYVQVTGHGDFTNINIAAGDAGGEMDPHGPDGLGNPHGGLVFSTAFGGGKDGEQIHEWTNFMSFDQFCFRACKDGPEAKAYCQHIYDVLGCVWNIPGDYSDGFDDCEGNDVIPMGLYPQPDGSTSTFHQGEPVTPPAQPAAPTSECTAYTSASLYAFSSSSTITSVSSSTRSGVSSGSTTTTETSTSASSKAIVGVQIVNVRLVASLMAVIGFALAVQ